ncbi:MAG: TonB-dependent receptor [Ignavibacteriaceae bacterium]|jgi:outer membrane receptor protein involved in Fe transport
MQTTYSLKEKFLFGLGETAKKSILFSLFLFVFSATIFAGQTGKISGKVVDAETGEAIIGANIVIEGTFLGAAADFDGYYFINNIPPGEYRIIASAVGYQKVVIQKVQVKIDLTTKLDIKLSSQSINIDKEVVITAERPLVQKDLTSSSVTVSASDIKMMPVENISQVINLQAGVVDGHFRGGRSGEVAYLVDGVSVTDAFNGGFGIQLENSSIREMEVISGTFNAEYGQAMSGIVNIVTQDGSSKFGINASAYVGNYFTSHTEIFRNLDKFTSIKTKDFQVSLGGPAEVLDNLSYFVTARYYKEDGFLFGKRVYLVSDNAALAFDNPFDASGQKLVIDSHSGDGANVAMNPSEKMSLNAKLSYTMKQFKFSYSYFGDDNYNRYYDHYWSWTPDGTQKHYRFSHMNSFQITHVPSQSTFQTLKFNSNYFNYKGYLYSDPYDPRYVRASQGTPLSANYTFQQGGNQSGRYARQTLTNIIQWSISSQVSKEHKIGAGIEGRFHAIYNHGQDLIDQDENDSVFTPWYRNLGTQGNQEYTKYPKEFAAYIQDKMEYDIMIINAGIRLDYFDPNSEVPTDLRNPSNNPDFPGAGQRTKTTVRYQLSPRLGVSFPITDQGIIHFSYGHFFQIPSFENLFINSDYLVTQASGLSQVTGNPNLKPQKTIMYEIGLQQILFPNISLNTSIYYRDIRNLLGMEILNTYEGVRYARFVNRDYGNVRGFIVTLERRFIDYFGAKLDYTYQIAEGNASDPYAVFNNNQTNPPVEANKKVVPLNWDQRSTLNLSLTVGQPGDWSVGLILGYGSGFPYTESERVSNGVRFENGGIKPPTYNVDLRAEKTFDIYGLKLNTFVLIYNLLDTKNEYGVNSASGRANVDIFTYEANQIIGLNTVQEYLNNPTSFSSPRQIRLGMQFGI